MRPRLHEAQPPQGERRARDPAYEAEKPPPAFMMHCAGFGDFSRQLRRHKRKVGIGVMTVVGLWLLMLVRGLVHGHLFVMPVARLLAASDLAGFCNPEAAAQHCAPPKQCYSPPGPRAWGAGTLQVRGGRDKHPLDELQECSFNIPDIEVVSRCRALKAVSNGSSEVEAARKRFAELTCPLHHDLPAYNNMGDVQKYEARQAGCHDAKGMWGWHHSTAFHCVARVVGELLALRADQLVLDWGCGCGHKLTTLAQLYGIMGFGLDITESAVAWAEAHSVGKFCQGDGSKLDFLPDDTFDAVVSYAALYHIPQSLQCETMKQLVRVVRPGGKIWVGWNGAHERVEPEWWAQDCLAGNAAVAAVQTIMERDLFVNAAMGEADVGADFHELYYQYDSYSLLVTVQSVG